MRRISLLWILAAGALGLAAAPASGAGPAPDLRAATPAEQAMMEAASYTKGNGVTYTYGNARVSPSLGIGAIDSTAVYSDSGWVEIFTIYPAEVHLDYIILRPVTCDRARGKDIWDVDLEAMGIVPPDACSEGLSPYLSAIRIKTFKRKINAYNKAVTKTNRHTKRVCQRKRSESAVYRCARSAYHRYTLNAGYAVTEIVEDFAATVSWAFCKKALLGMYTNLEASIDARLEMYKLFIKRDWVGGLVAQDESNKAAGKAKRNKESILANCPVPRFDA